MRYLLLALPALAAALSGASPADCLSHARAGRRTQAQACYTALTNQRDHWLRAEGFYGLRRYREANDAFRAASAAAPQNPEIKVRWGRLLIEPFNKNLADGAALFSEALEIRKDHPGALLGMALIASEGFDRKAVEFARQALQADPKLVEAQELLAILALEDADPGKAREEAARALTMSPEALDALAVLAAVEILADQPPDPHLERIRKINPVYGRAHALIAHQLVINRRYEEAIEQYRQALELDPEDWATRSELGINLMRLARDDEARRELTRSFENGCRNAATVNSLRLLDSYRDFVSFRSPKSLLKLHKGEADLLRIYFEEELERAIAVYEKKYRLKLPRPVQLEVYPNHDDFAVRTMGMPGLGALGVTFGDVVAMDSPSGRKPGTFHWASTLWHELSHVFVLVATRHRVPRWFTEGVAVHEETAIHSDWGDRLTPEIVTAIKDKRLLPVAQLDRGFIRPSYPSQIIVSYFQAGRICDFIHEKWGWEKILEMMNAFGARRSTPEVVRQVLGLEPEEFDKRFLAWLDVSVKSTVTNFETWKKRMGELAEAARAKRHDDVVRLGRELIELYPEFVEAGNAYEIVAASLVEKGDKKGAAEVLDRYARTGGRSPDALKRLSALYEEAGNQAAAAAALARLNWIYPVNDEDLHRRLGALLLAGKNYPAAIREFRAVIAQKPLDQAAAHYDLARAHFAAGDLARAEDALLVSLEAAPGYRPAQKLLLELHARKEKP